MIKIFLDKEQVGSFNKLTLFFIKESDYKLILDEELEVAFVLEEGFLDIGVVSKYFTGKSDRSIRFTIQFTLNNKDYYLNRGAFDSMISEESLIGKKALFFKIEGVGELVNPKEFPIELIKNNTIVVNG